MSLSVYPNVLLKYTLEQREEARELFAKRVDSSEHRKIDKLQKTENNRDIFQAMSKACH